MKNNTVPYIAIPGKPLLPTSKNLNNNSPKKSLLPSIISIFLLCGAIVVTSCALFPPKKGEAIKAEAKGRANISNVEGKLSVNNVAKIDAIAGLAYGTDYALGKVNDPPREVTVARDINQRVVSLAGSPTIEKMKEMQETIDKLTSTLELERDAGKKKLNDKDFEITALQQATKTLAIEKDNEIRKYMDIAQIAAANSDAYKAALAEYEGWFGLKAVWKGLLQFVKSSMWILGIGSILFLILRFASMSNPIAASIFAIFNMIGSWFVNIIKIVVPKAVEMAGHTTTELFSAYKKTMTKMIDGIQTLKDREKAAGLGGKKYTLDELSDELSKMMSDDDKKRVIEIKREIGYT